MIRLKKKKKKGCKRNMGMSIGGKASKSNVAAL
jgi:hypothetical protein